MFSGLRGSGGSPPMPKPPGSLEFPDIATPSMTNSGSLLALIEVPPRIRMCAPAPGSPLFWVTWTPVARPSMSWVTFVGTATLACDRPGDRESPLCTVSGGDDLFEDGCLAVEREDYAYRSTVRDDDDLNRRAESDTAGSHRLRA